MRDFELPGRSPVHAMNGMAATSHPIATLVALDVLRAGGNALDAAIAACAVQGVVEPQSTGIGGDCFALIAPGGSDRIVAFNGSGRAPAGLSAEWLLEQGITRLERQSPHAVTVPGAIDAWVRLLEAHGTMSLGDLLQPAIGYAREGYVVHQRVAYDWAIDRDVLAADPGTAALYLRDGRAYRTGEVHRQPLLAATLERIAEEGRDGFYKGAVAEDIVGYLKALGGRHSLEDFATAAGEFVAPVSTGYRGYEVFECPPNGQGVAALAMLRILEGFDLAALDPLSAERLHLEIEAARLAYHDRDLLLGDPAQAEVPTGEWLSEAHAARRRAAIDPARAMTALPEAGFPVHADTIYLTVVDKDRNAVSFINSLFNGFGSGLMAPKSGVLLHNRGCGFVVKPGHPNSVAPGKRPLHTIIPGMLCRDGRAVMPFGVMGGQYQAAGHAHLLSNIIDHGLDVQAAIDLPRVFPPAGGGVDVESGVPQAVREELTRRGHRLRVPGKPIGGAQAIWIDWRNGALAGGSDPRKDGLALGY
jgi:gamma-glutamyltranspeptidase/glutathione hydrolase